MLHSEKQKGCLFGFADDIEKQMKNDLTLSSTLPKNDDFQFLFFRHICSWRWRRQWHPTPVLLPGKFHGRRSLVGCSPWGREESDTTEWLHFHFSLSCIGEGNGSPLQCSRLENPRDGGAWWAAVCGVAQSRTRLSDSVAAAAGEEVACLELGFYTALK